MGLDGGKINKNPIFPDEFHGQNMSKTMKNSGFGGLSRQSMPLSHLRDTPQLLGEVGVRKTSRNSFTSAMLGDVGFLGIKGKCPDFCTVKHGMGI